MCIDTVVNTGDAVNFRIVFKLNRSSWNATTSKFKIHSIIMLLRNVDPPKY